MPLCDVIVFEMQFFARGVRRIDDEDVGPGDKLSENLLGAGRLQVERNAAFVAIVEMPLVRIICQRLRLNLVPISPRVAFGGSTLMTSAPKSDRITAAAGPAT